MYKAYNEIFTQGDVLKQTYDYVQGRKEGFLEFIKKSDINQIVFVACGSSYWMSLSASRTIQKLTGIPCFAIKSGDVVFDEEYFGKMFDRPLFITPSRSGKTSETLRAVEYLKGKYQAPVLAIVEYDNNRLQDYADYLFLQPWANEESICQTRSFSCLYLTSIMLAAFLSDDEELLNELKAYLEDFQGLREGVEETAKKITKEVADPKSVICLATGAQYGVAIEGAYISVEMAQFQGSYYGLLEFRHGPIVMADRHDLVAIFCSGIKGELEEDMAKEIRETGAKVLAIGAQRNFQNADYAVDVGRKTRPEVTALFGIYMMQAYAYYQALALERNPDQPKELVPFIDI